MARFFSFRCFTRRSGIIYSIFLCLLCYTKSKEYDKNGVFVFWDWIHENKNNRLYVINQLKKNNNVSKKRRESKGGQLPLVVLLGKRGV